jgi:hypothetical protein
MAKIEFQFSVEELDGVFVVHTGTPKFSVIELAKESEAQRLCDLLNGAADLFRQGAKFEADENGKLVFLKKKEKKAAPVETPAELEPVAKPKKVKKAKAA